MLCAEGERAGLVPCLETARGARAGWGLVGALGAAAARSLPKLHGISNHMVELSLAV